MNSQTVSQVDLSPDGKQLVIVSKEGALLQNFPGPPLLGSGRIYVYELDGNDRSLKNCGDPAITALPSNVDGVPKWPYSFAWSQEGKMLLTEVFGAGTSLAGSAVTSWDLDKDGSLTPITVSVGNGKGATCWIVSAGRYAYTANYANDDLSSYTVGSDGQLAFVGVRGGDLRAGIPGVSHRHDPHP